MCAWVGVYVGVGSCYMHKCDTLTADFHCGLLEPICLKVPMVKLMYAFCLSHCRRRHVDDVSE